MSVTIGIHRVTSQVELTNLTGQVQRESQGLRAYRDALPVAVGESDSAQASAPLPTVKSGTSPPRPIYC